MIQITTANMVGNLFLHIDKDIRKIKEDERFKSKRLFPIFGFAIYKEKFKEIFGDKYIPEKGDKFASHISDIFSPECKKKKPAYLWITNGNEKLVKIVVYVAC